MFFLCPVCIIAAGIAYDVVRGNQENEACNLCMSQACLSAAGCLNADGTQKEEADMTPSIIVVSVVIGDQFLLLLLAILAWRAFRPLMPDYQGKKDLESKMHFSTSSAPTISKRMSRRLSALPGSSEQKRSTDRRSASEASTNRASADETSTTTRELNSSKTERRSEKSNAMAAIHRSFKKQGAVKLTSVQPARDDVRRSSDNESAVGKLDLDQLQVAAKARGFSDDFAEELANPHWYAYFVDTKLAAYFAANYPELLLLPWERMRAMGVVKLLNPVDTEYTFLSHQWQTPEHPWPDLLQVTEHLKYIRTPWIWADW